MVLMDSFRSFHYFRHPKYALLSFKKLFIFCICLLCYLKLECFSEIKKSRQSILDLHTLHTNIAYVNLILKAVTQTCLNT